jgi:hypothetical protein
MLYASDGQTTARGPDAAREMIPNLTDEKKKNYFSFLPFTFSLVTTD